MYGLRKFIYCIVFGFLELVLVSVAVLTSKPLGKWETVMLIAILTVYPLHNLFSKMAAKKINNLIKGK